MEKDFFGEYNPKKIQYKQYDGQDAAEIVIPTEVNLSFKQKENHGFSLSGTVNAFLDFAEELGGFYVRLFNKAMLWLLPILFLPLKLIIRLVKWLYSACQKLKDKNIRQHLSSTTPFRQDIKRLRLMTLKQEDENRTSYFLKGLKGYIVDYLPEEKEILKHAASFAFPVCVAIVLAVGLFAQKDKVFALKVMYGQTPIGYIENQEVYSDSRDIISSMLSDEKEYSKLLSEITLSLERVEPADLSSADMISEAVLALSEHTYKRACGIYIDGAFLCAIDNESDAVSLFSGLLEPYEKNADSATTVGFVEEIEYIQGYYPENSDSLWDSAKLKSVLTGEDSPVRIKVMKTKTRTETLKYETVKKNSSTLYKGTKKTTQKGKNGKVQITELVTYIDSKKAYTGVISQVVTKQPTDEIILIGTKSNSSASSYTPSRSFIWPTSGANAISSRYGYRSASISGWSFHGGVDIVLGYGSSAGIPVIASASGTVVTAYSGWRGYGHTVVIDHGNGIKTRYAHMYPGSITVRVGQKVYQGQQIGRIGSTGNSTGPHLHFEVLVGGNKVNPLPYIS